MRLSSPRRAVAALLLWLPLAGCALSHAEVDPVDPVVAVDEVLAALSTANQANPAAAVEAWREAHGRFQRALEPSLRTHCGDRATTELEYRFGRVRAALDAGRPPATDPLVTALHEGLACLTARAPQPE